MVAATLHKAQSWVNALKTAVEKWDPAKHPRGRDGQFLEAGQIVRVYNGPNGPQIATGQVKAGYFAPDGRMFIGVDVGQGKMEWYRPKQIEHLPVKASLKPAEAPEMPLPAVGEKLDTLEWDETMTLPVPEPVLAKYNDAGEVPVETKVTLDSLSPEAKAALGVGEPNYPPPTATEPQPPAPGQVVIPAGKKPEDILDLMLTSAKNKGLVDVQFMADYAAMLNEDDSAKAHKLLASLMTRAKLGGKQRKRYKDVLNQHLEVAHGDVDIEPIPQGMEDIPDTNDIPDATEAQLQHEQMVEQVLTTLATTYGAVKGMDPEEYPTIADYVNSGAISLEDLDIVDLEVQPDQAAWDEAVAKINAGFVPTSPAFEEQQPAAEIKPVQNDVAAIIIALEKAAPTGPDAGDVDEWVGPMTPEEASDHVPGFDSDNEQDLVNFYEAKSQIHEHYNEDPEDMEGFDEYGPPIGKPVGHTQPSGAEELAAAFVSYAGSPQAAVEWLDSATIDDVAASIPELGLMPGDAQHQADFVVAYESLAKAVGAENQGTGTPAENLADKIEDELGLDAGVEYLQGATVNDIELKYPGWAPGHDPLESLDQIQQTIQILKTKQLEVPDFSEFDLGPSEPPEPKPGDVYTDSAGHALVKIGGPTPLDFFDYQDVYAHPSGSVITVDWANNVTKYSGSTGKKSSTSATWDKLQSGHGAWKKLSSTDAISQAPATPPAPPESAPTPKPIGTVDVGVEHGTSVTIHEGEEAFMFDADTAYPSLYVLSADGTVTRHSFDGTTAVTPIITKTDLYDMAASGAVKIVTPGKEPEPAPEAQPWPGTTNVNVPVGKTPGDLLAMLTITITNKSGYDVGATSLVAKLSTGQDSGWTHEEAQSQLAKLMSQYGLGGNQRKRYRSLLAMLYGVPVGEPKPQPSTGETSAKPGVGLDRLYLEAPKGPGIGVPTQTAANQTVNPSDFTASGAKAKIQEELNKRLADVPITDFIKLSRSPNYNSDQYSKNLAGKIEMMHKANTKVLTGFVLRKQNGRYLLEGKVGASVTIDKLEQALRLTSTAQMIQLWAQTSNDSNARSLAMQRAAQAEFGLGHVYTWPGEENMLKDEYQRYGLLFRRFLREMHSSTRQWLQTQGITHVKLYRGVKTKTGFNEKSTHGGTVAATVTMRPMSSFSSNRGTANSFAGRHGGGKQGTVFWAYVPIERIVGSAWTGFGCQSEYEWVVLAGDKDDRVWVT